MAWRRPWHGAMRSCVSHWTLLRLSISVFLRVVSREGKYALGVSIHNSRGPPRGGGVEIRREVGAWSIQVIIVPVVVGVDIYFGLISVHSLQVGNVDTHL